MQLQDVRTLLHDPGVLMLRYPFMAAVNRFMDAYFGVYSEGMYDELLRRYPKINKQLMQLQKEGKIKSLNPEDLTAEDIKQFVVALRSRGLKDTSISHDLSAIKNLCMYVSGNNCVEVARSKYPMLFSKRRTVRLPVIEKPQFREIVDYCDALTERSPERLIRAAAIVMFAFGSGARTQEIQHAKVRYVDPEFRYVFFDHVKGMDTYGVQRTAPIRTEAEKALRLYLKVRKSNSEYLFFNNDGRPLSTNAMTEHRNLIIHGTGIKFDYRTTRRTYAQYMVDEGLPIEWVAMILGHTSTKTTEQSYARPRNDRVVRSVIDMWQNEHVEVMENVK